MIQVALDSVFEPRNAVQLGTHGCITRHSGMRHTSPTSYVNCGTIQDMHISRYVFSEKAPLLIVKLIYSLKVFRAGIHGARERTYVPSMHLLNKSVHASVITLVNSSLVKNERDTARRLP
jgi:hypothetical protein